jgi:hypothetical protein
VIEVLRPPVESALAATVGVEDHPWARIAGRDGITQGGRDQPGAQMIGERVADDAAGGDVDHGGPCCAKIRRVALTCGSTLCVRA